MATLASVAFTVTFAENDTPHEFLQTLANIFAGVRKLTSVPAPVAPAIEPGYHATAPLIKAPAKPEPQGVKAVADAAFTALDAPAAEAPAPAEPAAPKKRGPKPKQQATGIQAPVAPAPSKGPLIDDPVPDFTDGAAEDDGNGLIGPGETYSLARVRAVGNFILANFRDGQVGHSLVMGDLTKCRALKYPDLTEEQRRECMTRWCEFIPSDMVPAVRAELERHA